VEMDRKEDVDKGFLCQETGSPSRVMCSGFSSRLCVAELGGPQAELSLALFRHICALQAPATPRGAGVPFLSSTTGPRPWPPCLPWLWQLGRQLGPVWHRVTQE
jgi:hypothetical protein